MTGEQSCLLRALVYGVILWMVLSLVAPEADVALQFIVKLLLGWATYPVDVLPLLRWNAGLIALGAACGAGFVVGWHLLLRSWRGAEWRVKYSLLTAGLVLAGFVAGIAAIGTVHQVSWMATSRERWVADAPRLRAVGSAYADFCEATAGIARELQSEREALAFCQTELSNLALKAPHFRMAVAVDKEGHWAAILLRADTEAYQWPMSVVCRYPADAENLPEFESIEDALGHFARLSGRRMEQRR